MKNTPQSLAASKLHRLITIPFKCDEFGLVDVDAAEERIFKAAQEMVAITGNNYKLEIEDVKKVTSKFGEIGEAVIDAAEYFEVKNLLGLIHAIFHFVATKEICQEQFEGKLMDGILSRIIAKFFEGETIIHCPAY